MRTKRSGSKLLNCLILVLLIFQSLIISVPTQASVLDVEILGNLKVGNTSGTTPDSRWPTTSLNEEVEFTLAGSELADVAVNLVGERQAVLVLPEELTHRVTPNGNANVVTNVTVDLSKVAILVPVMGVVADLVKFVDDILNGVIGIVGININLDEVTKQLELLDALQTLGRTEFETEVAITPDGQVIYTSIDKGLGPILAENLSVILTNLVKAVDTLKIEVKIPVVGDATALVVNGLLSPIKTLLSSTVATALIALKPTGEGIQQLADASVLGATTVTIPTEVSGPLNSEDDYDSLITATVVKVDLIDINLLVQSTSKTPIYFGGARLDFIDAHLPSSLNFGTHAIQTIRDELLIATDGGQSTGAITTSKISLNENRSGTKSWSLSVKQLDDWKSNGHQLTTPTLRIHPGDILTTLPESAIVQPLGIIEITSLNSDPIVVVGLTETTGTGMLELSLDKFELFVPKNTPKKIGTYQTTLLWNLTEGP